MREWFVSSKAFVLAWWTLLTVDGKVGVVCSVGVVIVVLWLLQNDGE